MKSLDNMTMPANNRVIALIGNANSGKTTLFNALTGSRQKTGNWPGVTVEKRSGQLVGSDQTVELIDLPGVYSLDHSNDNQDELIARQYLASGQADILVNVINASQLERSLYLTSQLLEFGLPVIVALNMTDTANRQGIHVDVSALSEKLGCPVIPCIAREKIGIGHLSDKLTADKQFAKPDKLPVYPEIIRKQLDTAKPSSRPALLEKIANRTDESGESFADLIAASRFEFASSIAAEVSQCNDPEKNLFSDRIDRLVLHPWLGVPVFLFMMYLMFYFTIQIGGAFIDFFDILSGAVFVHGTAEILSALSAPEWLIVLMADGLGAGIQTVSTFIPIIASLYLFLSFLEDSGYMARAAFVMNRLMSGIGLSGKAFVPLIVGFGCNVPAIMAARTLNQERERIAIAMMAPFMSCGARLSVYALFAAAFFTNNGEIIVFTLYLAGIIIALLTGLFLKKTLLPGDAESLVIELPSYHRPALRNLLIHTWMRLRGFILDAGRLIIIMVVIINLANSIGTDGSFGNENTEKSVLSASARSITPLFEPIGIEEDNWPAVVGLLSGILAKEVVVGTLDALYSAQQEEDEASFSEQVSEAFASIPDNLGAALSEADDPLGISSLSETVADEGVAEKTLSSITNAFDGNAGAYAYLIFVLLYFPCASTVAAIYREAGKGWALFAIAWGTTLAYILATLFYQTARFYQAPAQALSWFLMSFVIGISAYWLARYYGSKENKLEVTGT